MKKVKDYDNSDKENGRAAILFVAAVLVIGSSSMVPPAFFGDTSPQRSYEFEDVNGNTVTVNRQTGRYLKEPSRF